MEAFEAYSICKFILFFLFDLILGSLFLLTHESLEKV